MAYIGNTPAEKYISLSTQHFSVSATANYTLTSSVTNEDEIALFINNVRQEPGTGYAYTAAGTALTLSAATAGTDTMYCVYLGKARETVTPPDGSVTDAKIVGMASSKLTGALPAIDGSAVTGITHTPANNSVGLAQMASGTDGNLITYDASGDPAHVAVGTATHVLTSNGAGAAPTFQAAGGGGLVHLATTEASTAASVAFTSTHITATYDHYVVKISNMNHQNDSDFRILVSNDNGSSYEGGSNYNYRSYEESETGAVYNRTAAGQAKIVVGGSHDGEPSNSHTYNIEISGLMSAAKKTTFRWSAGYRQSASSEWFTGSGGGEYLVAEAVNNIQFIMASGTITGTFSLFGVSKS